MALQHRMLFLPPGAERISEHLAAAHHDGRLTFFDASGPIFSCREEDEGALRFAAAMLTEPGLGLAGPSQIARAVRRHRSQVHEYRARYREGGAGALEVRKRGPRGASKLKGPVLAAAQAGLTAGLSNCKVAAQVGVSEQTIRKGLKDGRLVRQPGVGRRSARWRRPAWGWRRRRSLWRPSQWPKRGYWWRCRPCWARAGLRWGNGSTEACSTATLG